jgi:uncharacterized protein involved in exopolysaccharide biosynthesis
MNETRVGYEIGLSDICAFVRRYWRILLVGIFMGLLISSIYLIITPKEYEAISQLQVAQLVTNKNKEGEASIINVENPAILSNRLKSPVTYSEKVLNICGFSGEPLSLAASVNSNIPKGATNTLEVRLRAKSQDLAIACLSEIFTMVQMQEVELAQPYIQEMNEQIESINKRIQTNQAILEKSAQLPLGSWSYFFNLDEIRRLYSERDNLKNVINLTNVYKAKLLIPPYTLGKPVAPNRYKSVLVGLIVGFGLALLYALFLLRVKKPLNYSRQIRPY